MGELQKLPNIGKELEAQLNSIGVHTANDLKALGSKEAWLQILAQDSSACINRLYGLEGAIRQVRWHSLEDEVKKELKDFYTAAKQA